MAHIVRTEDLEHYDPRTPDRADTDEVCIDLRDGDLSDEAVVSILLQLARERAAEADQANVLGAAERGPGHVTTYQVHEPRRRWWPAAAAIGAVVVVAALVAIGSRARQDPTGADLAATGAAPSSIAAPTTQPEVRTQPSTRAPRPSPSSTVPVAAIGAGSEADRATEFCSAVGVYTLDNLITLAENGVRDPRGTIAAYATLVATAPPEIADDVTALGPITGKVQAEIETGAITTPEQMQQYLAGGAPADEVARWIAAQQAIVAELPRLCPDHVAP